MKCARFPVAIRIQSKARRIKYNMKARESFAANAAAEARAAAVAEDEEAESK